MLKKFKKQLRASQTDAEPRLWFHLRSRSFQGCKFRRQHILLGYIVDFVCLERKLVIELDGGQHLEQEGYDTKRTQALEKDGFKVIRFRNTDMLKNLDSVLESILNTPHPPLRDDLSHTGERLRFYRVFQKKCHEDKCKSFITMYNLNTLPSLAFYLVLKPSRTLVRIRGDDIRGKRG